MIGDQVDMLRRLKTTLPGRWFPNETPVLDGVLLGLAASWSWVYTLLEFGRRQTRVATASGIWLDMIASDFFGVRLYRRGAEADPNFRRRILRELSRERVTRQALVAALKDVTGHVPIIFEPSQPQDTGAYGSLDRPATGLGYGMAGGWGNLGLPFQCFVTVRRRADSGIANVAGWSGVSGGYGAGSVEYADLTMIQGQITDADIYRTTASVLPVGAIAWTRIVN